MNFLELLKNIDYFSFIAALLKWMFLFLLVSILMLIVSTRFKLFKRRTKVARILVKAYYVIVPVYFLIFALKFAPVRNSQVELNKAIDKNKKIATEFAYSFLSSVVSDSLLNQEASAKDIVNNYLNRKIYMADSLAPSEEMGIGKRFAYKVKKKLEYGFLIRLVESKIIKNASGWVGIDDKTGKALYRTDFKSLFSEGEIIEIFKRELNRIYRTIYKSMFILFAFGLLIPVFETVISKILKY